LKENGGRGFREIHSIKDGTDVLDEITFWRSSTLKFTSAVLQIDTEKTIQKITAAIRKHVLKVLHRKGAVVGMSGGVDSSVCAALCAKALGTANVLALFMPERDSSPESLRLGKLVAENLGIPSALEDIEPVLRGSDCYRRQVEAIQATFPDYDERWKCKVVFPSKLKESRLSVFELVVQTPSGELKSARMDYHVYLRLIAATNFKQRIRKMMEYYHADRLNYAVCGTPNRLEYDQGFFVKNGDGSADFKPIAHLYKTQVYDLAKALGIPPEVTTRPPTTDTFSLPQTQEEFYFTLPYRKMDLCLFGYNHNVSAEDVAREIALTPEQIERIYRDIEAKRRGTRYLHLSPLLTDTIPEVTHEYAEYPNIFFVRE